VELRVAGRETYKIGHNQPGDRLLVHAAQPSYPLAQRTRQVLEELADRGPPELGLVPEVIREQGLLYAGPFRDQPGARSLEGPLGEQIECSRQDPLARRIGRRPLRPL